MVEIFLIAVSLALDAFAVSVSSGISIPGFGPRQAVKMGLWFGTFQFLMPLLGWLLGSSVSQYIEAVDHWVAFGLLAVIGGKMAWESLRRGCGEEGEAPPTCPPGGCACWPLPPASTPWPLGCLWPL
ncbi:MAG: manganese efflux pump MntP family protein [Flavonifractor plautii]